MANDDPTADAVIGALRSALVERGGERAGTMGATLGRVADAGARTIAVRLALPEVRS